MKVQLYAVAIEHAASALMDDVEERREAAWSGAIETYMKGYTPEPEFEVTNRGWWIFKRRIYAWKTLPQVMPGRREAEIRAISHGYHRSCEDFPAFRRAATIRAIARHHKPNMLLTIEGEELDLIATFLAPSEAYSDQGDGTERI